LTKEQYFNSGFLIREIFLPIMSVIAKAKNFKVCLKYFFKEYEMVLAEYYLQKSGEYFKFYFSK